MKWLVDDFISKEGGLLTKPTSIVNVRVKKSLPLCAIPPEFFAVTSKDACPLTCCKRSKVKIPSALMVGADRNRCSMSVFLSTKKVTVCCCVSFVQVPSLEILTMKTLRCDEPSVTWRTSLRSSKKGGEFTKNTSKCRIWIRDTFCPP